MKTTPRRPVPKPLTNVAVNASPAGFFTRFVRDGEAIGVVWRPDGGLDNELLEMRDLIVEAVSKAVKS